MSDGVKSEQAESKIVVSQPSETTSRRACLGRGRMIEATEGSLSRRRVPWDSALVSKGPTPPTSQPR